MRAQATKPAAAAAPARGYVLILVLALIVILTAAGAALYRASESQRWALGAVSAESLALARANMGAQQMLARLRAPNGLAHDHIVESCGPGDPQGENATFPVTQLGCIGGIYAHEGPDNLPASVAVNRVTGRDEHLFSTRLYVRHIDGLGGSGTDRWVIDSIGYVGKQPNRPVTSGTDDITAARVEMEVEFELPQGTNFIAGGS